MSDSWDEYKNLVLHELERTNKRLDGIDDKLSTIEDKITLMNSKIYAAAFVASLFITGVVQYIFII